MGPPPPSWGGPEGELLVVADEVFRCLELALLLLLLVSVALPLFVLLSSPVVAMAAVAGAGAIGIGGVENPADGLFR